jgi:hypothetical protein
MANLNSLETGQALAAGAPAGITPPAPGVPQTSLKNKKRTH